ncbi:MAG: hypothetical protein ACU836_15245 [Gammaproteobacteria bacterium]
MKTTKIIGSSVALLGTLFVSSEANAHFSLSAGSGADPVFLNGEVTPFLPSNATVPSLGYLGIHSSSNDRVFQTGQYVVSGSLAVDQLGGVFGNATPRTSETTEGQRYNYNIGAGSSSPLATPLAVSVGQGSWDGDVNDTDVGLSWTNPHFSSGGGNPELNLLNAGNPYINITIGDDPLFDGSNQLAFTLYQGWVQGAGLTGLHALYTGMASAVGQDLGVTLALTGNQLNGVSTAGEYTIVVGDASSALDNSTFDGHYRIGIEVSNTASYGVVVSAVPVPGAVWLFGSAMAGLIGFGKRKRAI